MNILSCIKSLVKDIDPKVGILDMEGKCLYNLSKRIQGNIVEIGSWKGRSTIWLAFSRKNKVYAIDPHKDTGTHRFEGEEDTFVGFGHNIDRAKLWDVVVPIKKTSEEANKGWYRDINLLLIDGSHEYEDILLDFVLWSRFVPLGGYVALHDTIGYEGPRRLASENLFNSKYWKIIRVVGQLVVARKCRKSEWVVFCNYWMLVYKVFYDGLFRVAKLLPRGIKERLKG